MMRNIFGLTVATNNRESLILFSILFSQNKTSVEATCAGLQQATSLSADIGQGEPRAVVNGGGVANDGTVDFVSPNR